ncbi:hypothetical protein GIB67_038450 [Kingdonia uniflora]|uniref:DYW domain-containing protein n=1 Tax=Kingdonia uniflora TaxID=39325 RepID=A0A7J7NPA9_9MAGN|nr:hypothetical protein GIB67_038450 [Kingdonia uniflora]
MHESEEEEREFSLRYRSKKLAISFGLMKTNHGTIIRIVKNLRMCTDCHSAIKCFSFICNREITVRDKHRFHHFKDGSCSCQDYCCSSLVAACCSETVLIEELAAAVHEFELLPLLISAAVAVPCFAVPNNSSSC